MPFINVHTHNSKAENLSIINLFPRDADNIEKDKYYSIGIHPWEVSKANLKEQLSIIERIVLQKNILAIGEIGLDKLHNDFELQEDVFNKQFEIAKKHNKAIIIHCVKSYSELLNFIKSNNLKVPVIIHRYSGNKTIADELIKLGCYLSFGHELFNSKSKTQKVFKNISPEYIFLETDDSNIEIVEIYKKAAEIKKIDVAELQKIIEENFKKCFKR